VDAVRDGDGPYLAYSPFILEKSVEEVTRNEPLILVVDGLATVE
jgi:hypothetical protein